MKNISFRAGTISTVAIKTAYGFVMNWLESTGKITNDGSKTVSKAYKDFLAWGIEGVKRTTGQHPGGIIVIPSNYEVEDFTPVNYPANDVSATWKTTHFDFHAIHDNVLKLDLLGHDDPTAIKMLETLTNTNAKEIPFQDERVISLFSSPKELGIESKDILDEKTGVMGIPEFGTKFVRRMLSATKVKSFGDLIAISGLSHGTGVWTGNADTLVKKMGLSLSEVISCRDNIMQDLIFKGLDNLEAFKIMELVRKGKGLTNEQKENLKSHGVEDWYIDSLTKIQYMFPKAHATAYVMMAWRIAWYKLYYPLEYYATYLSTRIESLEMELIIKGNIAITERLKELKKDMNKKVGGLSTKEKNYIPTYEIIQEMLARGFKIGNISLKHSKATSWNIHKEKKLLYPPFVAVDGIGISAANSIVEARQEKEFSSIKDLKMRTQLNVTSLDKLEKLSVLEDLDETNQLSFNFNL